MPNQNGLVVSERVQLTVHLPRGSGVRTVEVSRGATAEEVIAKLAEEMGFEKYRWKLYARSEGGFTKVLSPNEKVPIANISYYLYPLP